jgi:phosphoribosyl-AMP cyclohydrolase
MSFYDDLKYDDNGLIPAIIQDVETKDVLMVAYMNKDSLLDTVKKGKTHFWSRSRQKYWMKGESSGHVQNVKKMFFDCDLDCIVIHVEQVGGAACHVGYRSCFYRKLDCNTEELSVIAEKIFDPDDVY